MKETINEKMITEEQIQRWADEAEQGYDVQKLKARGKGRPGRGAKPSQVIAVRFTEDELTTLDQKAKTLKMTRSEYIRKVIFA